jgi:glucose/arabinose dehydrogenase
MPLEITMRVVADDLDFPTSLAFDAQGVPCVAESGLPLDGAPRGGRVLRLRGDGSREYLVRDLRAPVTGLVYYDGYFYVSEGGNPGRISRLSPSGDRKTLLDGLPGFGNYHTNTVAIGPDGKMYFGQGAHTNSGIIGTDSLHLAWLGRLPHDPDIPGYDVRLSGWNAETIEEQPSGAQRIRTGPFVPYGTSTVEGQIMTGRTPCTAGVMRANLDGSQLELVAWGIRNAFGLGFLPDGRLLATDQGADQRGSRPIVAGPELLYEVKKGSWYGWPDFVGGEPVTDPKYRAPGSARLSFLLSNHDELPRPERPVTAFPANSAATKFDVTPEAEPCGQRHLIVALFGDEKPMTSASGPRAGRALALVNLGDWSVRVFAQQHFARPIDVRFSPQSGELHVLDFGEFEMGPQGRVMARRGSGRLAAVEVRDIP